MVFMLPALADGRQNRLVADSAGGALLGPDPRDGGPEGTRLRRQGLECRRRAQWRVGRGVVSRISFRRGGTDGCEADLRDSTPSRLASSKRPGCVVSLQPLPMAAQFRDHELNPVTTSRSLPPALSVVDPVDQDGHRVYARCRQHLGRRRPALQRLVCPPAGQMILPSTGRSTLPSPQVALPLAHVARRQA